MFWLAYGEYTGRRTFDRFMRYFDARVEQERRDLLYRQIVSEAVQGKRFQGDVSYLNTIIPTQADTRTGDEIAFEVIKRAGLKFASEEE